MKILSAVFLPVLFMCVGCANTDLKTAPSSFRVLSYNIHHGEGIDKKIDLQRIAAVIKESKADIVGLQEVDRGVERTDRRDLPKELAKLTGMKVYFERNIIYQGGDYGNAVLTKFPIKKKKNTHYKMLWPDEQRGVIQVFLNVHGKDLLFMNTHIDYRPDDAERLLNAEEMRKIIAAAGKTPVILCGDFNSSPGSSTHNKIKEFMSDTWELVGHGDGFSFSAETPASRIDYLWITKDSIQPLQMEVLKSDASDHLPVMGEFRFR